MRESKAWQAARKLPKGPPGSEERKARAKAFKEISAAYGFTSGDIQRFAQQCRDACWIKDHLGGHDTQTTSLRAFRAVEQYSFGRRGRPRFRRVNEVNSIEAKEARPRWEALSPIRAVLSARHPAVERRAASRARHGSLTWDR